MRNGRRLAVALIAAALLAASGTLTYLLLRGTAPQQHGATTVKTTVPRPSATQPAAAKSRLQLDPKKSYGNRYAAGLLPVGDGKYSTATAAKGTVYVCAQYAQNLQQDMGGAQTRGSWFTNRNSQYDISKKPHIGGNINWKGSFSNVVSGTTRTITTNDLPLAHMTGVFPVAATDPAYQYDRNPNSIKPQTLTYALAAVPQYGEPHCMSGEAGVMLTGVALFNGFDAGGRDAGAWEVQDGCGGHPQASGEYHYHTLSSCIKNVGVDTVIGFALDGFPITGPQISPGNILTTNDLDECHGLASTIILDKKEVTTYHYVMTQDFPYSVSCFRAQPMQLQGPPQGSGQQRPQGPRPLGGTNPASASQ